MPQTLFDKIWSEHTIKELENGETLLAIDRVMLHERTGSIALESLADAGRSPIAPDRVFCVMDHIVSNDAGRGPDDARMPGGADFIRATRNAAERNGLHLVDIDDRHQGITHVIAPELGIATPGLTILCPDSHTCSLGATGALAWGVGSSAAEQAIATGALRVTKPKQMRIRIDGQLALHVYAKDIALHIISKFGAGGAMRCAIEFAGDVIERMPLDSRLTLCNMAVEFSAFTALIAPNDDIINAFASKPFGPAKEHRDEALNAWRALASDTEASFDYEIQIDANDIEPMVSWGTSVEETTSVTGKVGHRADRSAANYDATSLTYMALTEGEILHQLQLDGAFIGSCTNGRLSDLREAARYLIGQHVPPQLKAVCVPGSMAVKKQAEAEGLDRIFIEAGFEWGAPGCAMCFYAGGETFPPGARVISSTNRNFKGRQGPDVRTHLASPATVAASAIAGHIVDIRNLEPPRGHDG